MAELFCDTVQCFYEEKWSRQLLTLYSYTDIFSWKTNDTYSIHADQLSNPILPLFFFFSRRDIYVPKSYSKCAKCY